MFNRPDEGTALVKDMDGLHIWVGWFEFRTFLEEDELACKQIARQPSQGILVHKVSEVL